MLRIVLQSLKIVTIAVMAVLIVAGGARAFDYYMERSQPDDLGETVRFTVNEDDTVEDVAKRLNDAGLIRYELAFEGFIRVANTDVVPDTYSLRKGMSSQEIVDILTGNVDPEASSEQASNEEGDDAEEGDQDDEEADIVQLTVPEGWRTEQIAEELVNIGWDGSVEDFMQAVEEFPVDNYDFIDSRDNEAKPDSLEGFLFPDTYEVRTDEPAQDIIQKMLLNFEAQFTPQMRDRAAEMDLSIYQVLIFASLIEREAKMAEERPIIADVFLNRYESGINMDSDPTVRFAIGKEDGGDWWDAPSPEQLEETESPYNTYKNLLPPGPICNPSLDSIQAVLTPGGTEYLYFVLIDEETGKHLFAYDEAGQNQNINYRDGNANAPAPGSDPFASAQAVGQGGDGEEIPIESTGG